VRGGDDDAGAEAVEAGEEGDGGGGDDTGAFDRGTARDGGDPGAGLAGVQAQQDARGLAEVMGEGTADGVDGGGI
jgi:hypothetical protein